MYHLPRKFPLFFTDELSIFTSFSSSAIVPRTISVIFSSSSLDAEKRKNTRARAHLLFLSLSHFKSSDTKTKRNEKRAQVFRSCRFRLPRSFRERSQLLFHHHRSTPRNRRTPERARTFFSISHFKSSDTKTKRNEKRAQKPGLFIFRDRSDDAFGTISGLEKPFLRHHRSTPRNGRTPERARTLKIRYKNETKRKTSSVGKTNIFFRLPRSFRRRLRNDLRIADAFIIIAQTSPPRHQKNQKTTTTTTTGASSRLRHKGHCFKRVV